MLSFNAGETSRTLVVSVKATEKGRGRKVFYMTLSGASGAFIEASQGTGVVRNDDR